MAELAFMNGEDSTVAMIIVNCEEYLYRRNL